MMTVNISTRATRAAKLAAVTMTTLVAGSALAQPNIITLGSLPGSTYSNAAAISGDGSSVTGRATTATNQVHAFRWTIAGGMEDLGVLPGGLILAGTAISGDGSVVVGYSHDLTEYRAFRWTSSGGMEDLGMLPKGLNSFANAVSADGTAVAGSANLQSGNRAFRWTSGGGMEDLGVLPGTFSSLGSGISSDGTVVAGTCDFFGGYRAYRWTSAGGMEDLGVIPGSESASSSASAISGDGAVVVGSCELYDFENQRYRASRWTIAGGMHELGVLPGGIHSYANAVNGDGSLVVGSSESSGGDHAFLWTAALGMVDLNTYLPTLGVDLTGWSLYEATGISLDGSAITGTGHFNGYTQAFLVRGLTGCRPALSTQPMHAATCPGGAATFSISAGGTGPFTYQWQWQPAPGAAFVDVIDGANTDPQGGPIHFDAQGTRTGTVAVERAGGSGTAPSHWDMRCIVTNACGSVASNAATLTVCPADFNCDGTVNSADFFDFVTAFFMNAPAADFNADTFINSQDFFDFLAAFFVGC